MRSLAGRTVLLVEDEFHTTRDTLRYLRLRGANVVGPAPTLDYALEIIKTERAIDAAIVDTELRGVNSYPVADALIIRNIPMVFVTTDNSEDIPEIYRGVPRWKKPFELDDMAEQLFAIPRLNRRRRSHYFQYLSGAR